MSDSSKQKRKPPAAAIEPGIDPQTLAKAAHLTYISDSEPGIHRRRAGKRFIYVGPDGRRISDQGTLARIQRLRWSRCWDQPLSASAATNMLSTMKRMG
jgi:DNA topoisomerase IB